MYPPALMVKTIKPFTELIPFKALSDVDMDEANARFEANGEPYKIIRLAQQTAA
jgi:hypothetical protein|tara:strand:- start:1310 stop:1471 length:162 start_codon:yes stop_codon:yes gene_type:complete